MAKKYIILLLLIVISFSLSGCNSNHTIIKVEGDYVNGRFSYEDGKLSGSFKIRFSGVYDEFKEIEDLYNESVRRKTFKNFNEAKKYITSEAKNLNNIYILNDGSRGGYLKVTSE